VLGWGLCFWLLVLGWWWLRAEHVEGMSWGVSLGGGVGSGGGGVSCAGFVCGVFVVGFVLREWCWVVGWGLGQVVGLWCLGG